MTKDDFDEDNSVEWITKQAKTISQLSEIAKALEKDRWIIREIDIKEKVVLASKKKGILND
tara:strand:+ start:452 stop:634 length:183 start_codon:yes stop_codon:yes gene_type:complete